MVKNIKEAIAFCQQWEEKRDDYPYEIGCHPYRIGGRRGGRTQPKHMLTYRRDDAVGRVGQRVHHHISRIRTKLPVLAVPHRSILKLRTRQWITGVWSLRVKRHVAPPVLLTLLGVLHQGYSVRHRAGPVLALPPVVHRASHSSGTDLAGASGAGAASPFPRCPGPGSRRHPRCPAPL